MYNVCTHKNSCELQMYGVMQYGVIANVRIHAIFNQSITDPLADKDSNHDGDNIRKTTSQLKHDHHKRYCVNEGVKE